MKKSPAVLSVKPLWISAWIDLPARACVSLYVCARSVLVCTLFSACIWLVVHTYKSSLYPWLHPRSFLTVLYSLSHAGRYEVAGGRHLRSQAKLQMERNIGNTRYSINIITSTQMYNCTHTMWKYNIRSSEGSAIMLFLVVGRDIQEMLSAAVSYLVLSASARHLSAKNPVYTCCKMPWDLKS